MLKIRVTYRADKPLELDTLKQLLEDRYIILNQSAPYKGRGNSVYNNVYFDVEEREVNQYAE